MLIRREILIQLEVSLFKLDLVSQEGVLDRLRSLQVSGVYEFFDNLCYYWKSQGY